ncbi:MAG TPA: protein translocase subunit SecF [Candidatus Faecicola pullistercoris]|nr:protein translocase subunit SecF [Candidatus Faecicola pullistercoris]
MSNLKIVNKWKIWFAIPAVIMIAGIIMLFVPGMNVGIEFTGGTIMTVTLGELADGANYNASVAKITDIIEKNGGEVSYFQKSSAEETSKSAIDFRFRVKGDSTDIVNQIKNDVAAEFGGDAADTSFITSETIGESASRDLLKNAILGAAIAIALIMIYVIIRFEFWSGVTAVLALIHDVFIMIALTVIFQIQVNSSFVAAVITIIAYSINNTIVIFDRIRERIKPIDDKSRIDYAEVADEAINNTLTRTLFTSATTLITVIFLAILGVPSMREFTLPIIFGLVAGTYSSIFLSTPAWALINKAISDRKGNYNRVKGKTKFKKQR